ncbi:MAG: PH domain-containing protein [Actinomycetota bacterium]|nr:PH domain-containing protein [Actinomycetota bacterium]
MPISRQSLADDEEVLVDLRLHWLFFLAPALVSLVAVAAAVTVVVRYPKAPVFVAWVLAVMVAVPVLWLAGRLFKWMGISLLVTTTRLIYRQGILGRDLVQLRLQRVTEVHCTQTFVDRLVGTGRMVIEVEGDGPMAIDDVRRPAALQRVITRQLDALQSGMPNGAVRSHRGSDYEPSRTAAEPRGWAPSPGADSTPPSGTPSVHGSPGPGGIEPFAAGATGAAPPAAFPSMAPAGSVVPPAAPDHERGVNRFTSDEVGERTGEAGGTASIPQQLIALDELRRRGIISDEEFAAKKTELLGRM